MKEFDALYRRILPRVRGVAMPMVDEAIRQAGIEFCQRTRKWRDSVQITTTDDLESDIVVAPDESEVFEFESARFNDYPLTAKTRDWLDKNIHQWRLKQGEIATWITQSQPDTIRLVPAAAGTVDLDMYLQPANDATTFPDFMIDHHTRVLSDGAMAELYATPGDFQNPGLAAFHSNRFNERLAELFDSHAKGQQGAPVRTIARFQ